MGDQHPTPPEWDRDPLRQPWSRVWRSLRMMHGMKAAFTNICETRRISDIMTVHPCLDQNQLLVQKLHVSQRTPVQVRSVMMRLRRSLYLLVALFIHAPGLSGF